MTRARLVLLALCCTCLLSGRAREGPLPEVGATAAPIDSSAYIHQKLAELNPHLTDAQVARIQQAILRYSDKYSLDPLLVTAVIEVESAARPWARSPSGALGLMQVMPYMIRPMDLAGNASTVEANIEAGCMILAGNIRRLGEEDGISAYFWGSNIRGVTYLNRVRAARERLRRELPS
jgi:soluble lytic murein transglycosylase-like protein